VLKANPDKVGKKVKNTKIWSKPQISINQVPRPYKPPSAKLLSEYDQNSSSGAEYSNVKKASLALNKSAVSAKISKYSSQDEKPHSKSQKLTKLMIQYLLLIKLDNQNCWSQLPNLH
jgi:hypothetical protein